MTSKELRKEPCLDCGSSDALGVYDDGHTHCYSCNKTTQPTLQKVDLKTIQPKSNTFKKELLKGEVKSLKHRGLTEETCRKFGYLCHKDLELGVYRDKNGKAIAQKVRDKNKNFSIIGDAS